MSEPDLAGSSLRRLAEELGVSAKTVSNAFNRPDQLSVALRDRILGLARDRGYAGPDAAARAFRRGRSGMVGVIWATPLSYAVADPAGIAFLTGFTGVLDTEDVGLALIAGSAGTARSADGLGRAVIDGVVAYSLASDDPALAAARQRSRPIVLVDQPRTPGTPWVGIDDQTAAAEVAATLIAAGHRAIGVVSFGMNSQADGALVSLATLPDLTLEVTGRRLAGYAQALAPVVSLGTVPAFHGRLSDVTEGEAGAAALLDVRPDLTALICLSDQLARGAVNEVRSRGRSVPGDVSVVGFDGTAAAWPDGMTLTTVRQPHEEKGRVAAQLLLAALRGEDARSVMLPHQFVAGTTVGPLR